MDFIQNPPAGDLPELYAMAHLPMMKPTNGFLADRSAQFMGFNLIWGNVFADQVEIKCVSNCAVERDEEGRPRVDTLHSGVYGLANDLLGDEHVKVLYDDGFRGPCVEHLPGSVLIHAAVSIHQKADRTYPGDHASDGRCAIRGGYS